MDLENSFTVSADVEIAWETPLVVESIAPCMPGATRESINGNEFTNNVKVKLRPAPSAQRPAPSAHGLWSLGAKPASSARIMQPTRRLATAPAWPRQMSLSKVDGREF